MTEGGGGELKKTCKIENCIKKKEIAFCCSIQLMHKAGKKNK
jgi:hypothetical protein